MGLSAFLDLVGSKTGVIAGSARQETRKGKITVIAYEHRIDAERHGDEPLARTGMPTDKRRHGVLVVRKEFDHASPLLHKAHAEEDVFTTCSLHCWRVPPAGGGPQGVREENHWTVKLANARIAAIRTVMENARLTAFASMPEYEEVEFTYESILFGWSALVGKEAQVAQQDSQSIPGDFRKSDGNMVAKELVTDIAKDLGQEVGKQVADFLQKEAKKIVLDALKEK